MNVIRKKSCRFLDQKTVCNFSSMIRHQKRWVGHRKPVDSFGPYYACDLPVTLSLSNTHTDTPGCRGLWTYDAFTGLHRIQIIHAGQTARPWAEVRHGRGMHSRAAGAHLTSECHLDLSVHESLGIYREVPECLSPALSTLSHVFNDEPEVPRHRSTNAT